MEHLKTGLLSDVDKALYKTLRDIEEKCRPNTAWLHNVKAFRSGTACIKITPNQAENEEVLHTRSFSVLWAICHN